MNDSPSSVVCSRLSDARYESWCRRAEGLSIYALPWWIAAATGRDDWTVLWSHASPEESIFAWPLFIPTRGELLLPPYCQSGGITPMKPSSVGAGAFDRDLYIAHIEVMARMQQALPRSLRYIETNLPVSWQDWFPSDSPAGMFSARVAYTHRLDLSTDAGDVQYNSLIRRKIRFASKLNLREQWCVDYDDASVGQLLDLVRSSLRRSHGGPLYGASLGRLIRATLSRRQGAVLILRDEHGRPLAGAFVACHDGVAYYIAGGRSDLSLAKDAHALTLHRLIEWSRGARCHTFDFEGSMQPGIAFFFRSFGAEPLPYLRLSAGRSSLWRRAQRKLYYSRHIF